MITALPVLIALMLSITLGYVLYILSPVPAAYWKNRLDRVSSPAEQERLLPFWRALTIPFGEMTRRHAPARAIFGTKAALYWAQLDGKWLTWTEFDVWGLRLALAVVAAAYLVATRDLLVGLGATAILFLVPGIMLNSAANKARKRFIRELPDIVGLLALLVDTGASLSEGLRRVSEGTSIVSLWLRKALAAAQGQVLFGDPTGVGPSGGLHDFAEEAMMPELMEFTVQLDTIHQGGVNAGLLLGKLAENVTSNYQAFLNKSAEELGGKLLLPVMICFFIPYMAAILVPLFLSVIAQM